MSRDNDDGRPTRRRPGRPGYLPWAVGGAAVLLVAVAVAVGWAVLSFREYEKAQSSYGRYTHLMREIRDAEELREDIAGLPSLRSPDTERSLREWDARHKPATDAKRAEAKALREQWGARWGEYGLDPDDY